MNEMDTREGKGDIAGNAVVRAILLALCRPFIQSSHSVRPILESLEDLLLQSHFREGNEWLARSTLQHSRASAGVTRDREDNDKGKQNKNVRRMRLILVFVVREVGRRRRSIGWFWIARRCF